MTIYPPSIHQELKDFHIFLDTNVFIYAAKNEDFFNFLVELKDKTNCSYNTIPSVLFEFTNGADTLTKYNERIDFVKSLVDTVLPMAFLQKIPDFYVVMAKINAQNKAYTDFQLAACLYNYRHTKVALFTADLRALPAFYPRTHIITIEHEKEVKSFGFYQFDSSGYVQAVTSALSAK